MDWKLIEQKLQEPFSVNDIEWRVDRGTVINNVNYVYVLCYVTARAIQSRLDTVVGANNWCNQFQSWKGDSQLCGLSIYDEDKKIWITKWDGADDSNTDATKGGISGAMKRAAVQWGIGRYLYQLDQYKLELKSHGQHWAKVKVKSNNNDSYITGYWDDPTLPEWALRMDERGKQIQKQMISKPEVKVKESIFDSFDASPLEDKRDDYKREIAQWIIGKKITNDQVSNIVTSFHVDRFDQLDIISAMDAYNQIKKCVFK